MTDDNSDSLTLRVAKAIPSDVGHGRARVPFDNNLNLKPGDIIEVSGERKTAAIVWRCRPEDANLGVIRVDGIIRKNAGVSLGDRVDIKKVETQPCQRLVLSPVMAKQQNHPLEMPAQGDALADPVPVSLRGGQVGEIN